MIDLKGKVAIVTGAQRGIGEACAFKLAELGAKVAVTDITEEGCQGVLRKIESIGEQTIALKLDVTKEKDIKDVIDKVVKKWGRIDILVNNAGIFDYEEMEDVSKIDKILGVDLKGLMVVTKMILPIMARQKYGKIVNISSIAGLMGSPKIHSYSTAKAGVIGFTRTLAAEFGFMGINVNAIAPGAIDTPMLTQAGIDYNSFMAMVPKKRIGTPEDIACAVAFLSSDQADYITGQVLVVDGGYTIQ